MIYLDYQATTPLAPEALEAMLPWLKDDRVPHSAHREGRAVRGEEHGGLRVDRNGRAVRRHLRSTNANGDGARRAVLAHVDAIGTRANERHRAGRRVDLDVVIVDGAHAHERFALRQADLDVIVIERENFEGAQRSESNRVRANLQLGARGGVGPQ